MFEPEHTPNTELGASVAKSEGYNDQETGHEA